MRFLYVIAFFFLIPALSAVGQAVTTQPAFPTADAEVTLIFDVSQAKDGRARGLLGKTDDVYLWSGAGSTETGNAFEFQPAGQTDFAKPFAPGKMTSLGNNKWQIKLTPRTYFGVPSGTPIRRLGVLLKSGDGKAQTEDLFVRIYDGRLSLSRLEPASKDFFIAANTSLPVRFTASQRASLSVLLDGQSVASALDRDTLRATINTGTQTGVKRTVICRAQTTTSPTGQTAADTFYFTVRPEPPVVALPNGLRDGINYSADNRATLVLYAPKKNFVYLLGEFNNWTTAPQYLMNRTPDGNRYWLELINLTPGQEVAYQYLVDGTIGVADPYSDKILDRNNDKFIPATTYPNLKPFPERAVGNTVSVLQPAQTPYAFQTTTFQRPDPKSLVVYELLVRDFVQNRNYQTLTDSLPYLKRLGINTIELMPIMEFSGNDSWGYNPIFYFAPDKAYGTKNDLKRFIDAAHKQGIAVVLDMVLNQADYEFPYVKMYWDGTQPSADNPYFNQQATHPFSVFFDFNHESTDTKALVDRVCRYWLQEYKFDGFRFDLSKGFTQKNTGSDVGAWSAYDASRVAIWKRIYDQIRSYDPTAYIILEHFADNQEEKELADYGMLFWGNHNGQYRNAAKGVTAGSDFSGISFKARNWQKPNVVGYMESHDEERLLFDVRQNGRAQGSYNTKNLPTALDRAKLAAAFFLPVPGPKLIWQFGELGYDVSIDENGRTGAKPVRWEYLRDPDRLKLFDVYSELIKLKQTQPVFSTEDYSVSFDGPVKRLTLRSSAGTAYIIGNFDVVPQTVEAGLLGSGTWYDHFSGQEVKGIGQNAQLVLQPGEFHVFNTTRTAAAKPNLVPYTLNFLTITGVEAEPVDALTIGPNPVQTEVAVSLTNGYRGAVDLKLTDTGGRLLRSWQAIKAGSQWHQTLTIDTLPTGLYFLRIQQGDRQIIRKLVKL
ncbi:alpha amylase catalytic region [Fibrisoma limi BUZ 3]|uniref:Alpha amylase catalytic region n=1 Tax=Fibrisoma limi BUZ 3 TaxID=1185876 RepID=I2GJ16_9BACT|nr:alpha-amylase family glycosyl hydrolase [Fibrisoma limi]CCH53891.1 alpha amylase catalytic region [Fibrisoma limi BUZ 3]